MHVVVRTCCIYKSKSYIHLFNNCKEKCTLSIRPRVLKGQISQEVLVGIVIFVCLTKIYLSSFTWSKLHSKNSDETVSFMSWMFHILTILLQTSQVNNVWVLKLHALTWQTCNFALTKTLPCTDSFFYKNLLNHTAIFGSFSFPNEQR